MKKDTSQNGYRAGPLTVLSWVFIGIVSVLISSCSEPEENGTIGTGIVFRGTVSDQKQVVSRDVSIRAQSGERSTAVIAADGQFSIAAGDLAGVGPWLVRSDLGGGNFRYSIAYPSSAGTQSGIANVHSYSDVVLRSWFLQVHNLDDLDDSFDSTVPMPSFPSAGQFAAEADRYFALVERVLADYGVTGQRLLTDQFRTTDNDGVNLFLDLNPVVVDGREVTLVKTDPASNFQTSINVDLLLGALAGTPDTQSPSLPGNLRALSGSDGEIVLVWEPSTDNTAVVEYEIFRDNELIAVSPYPVFSDENVQPDTAFFYSVVAIDIAGNRSADAQVSTDGALRIRDTTPPPAPRALMSVEARTTRVELTWLQDDVSDVASFNVFRGFTPETIDSTPLTQVTNTSALDATVSAGLQFCYRISSVDASGNQSAPTEALCVTTTGIALPVAEVAPTDVLPLAGLRVPETDGLVCDLAFPVDAVNSVVTIPAGCYRVERTVTVDNFGRLTLQPGVILQFGPDTELLIESDGSLVSVGTADNPVVMTGEQPVRGWWRGVRFERSNSARNMIQHSVVEYAGAGLNGAAIAVISSTSRPTRLSIDNSLIRRNRDFAIGIPGLDSQLESFSGNLVTENERPAFVHFSALRALNDGSAFVDNDINRLFVPGSTYDVDLEIDDPGIPLQIGRISQVGNRTLIINEGVTIFFTDGDSLIARGDILIQGSPSNPVFLTANSESAGSWQGVQLIEGANAQLSNVIIEYAGQRSDANPDGANLFVNNARVSLENVTLRSSSSFGFHATGDRVVVDRSDSVISVDNARDDVVDPNSL